MTKNLLLIQKQILAVAQDDIHPKGQPRNTYLRDKTLNLTRYFPVRRKGAKGPER